MTLALVDFSSIFHRVWHINKEEAAHNVEAFINRIEADEVIVCLDAPPYERKKIDGEYKANRDIPDPELVGSMNSCIKKILDSGFKTARCQGWEADDVIATIAMGNTEESLIVYGSDKDLLQCVDLTNPFPKKDENPLQTSESRLGVKREQVRDYLAIVGDASDNVKGISGIGPKNAIRMLEKFGTLHGILKAVSEQPSAFTEKTALQIFEAMPYIDKSLDLVTLRTNLEIEYEQRNRVIDAEFFNDQKSEEQNEKQIIEIEKPKYIVKTEELDYRHSLEPVGTDNAWKVSVTLANSGLYQKLHGAEQIFAVIMRGRALGLDATTALDQINMIQGRPTLSAQAIIGIIKASPKCKYFHLLESTPDSCTWETFREGDPAPTRRTMTRKEADDSGFSKQPEYVDKRKTGKIITKEQWEKQPATMLMWRCGTALGRPVYPDLLNGIYATEELE